MTKHTPGPWVIVERHFDSEGDARPREIIGGAMSYVVCQMEPASVAKAYMTDESWSRYGLSEMQSANAQLISAAPDLLDAILGLLNAMPSATTHPAIKAARAAITKATGETT